jgi:hypothetical protein
MLPVPAGKDEKETRRRGVSSFILHTSSFQRPLILEHEIINLPSASALAIQRKETARRKMAEGGVAVIADPVFDSNDARLKKRAGLSAKQQKSPVESDANTRKLEHTAEKLDDQSNKRVLIPRLPFTGVEAERILAAAPATSNLKLLGFKANLAAATSGELNKYRYVHFATHGYLDSERPDLSAIVLSLVNEKGEDQALCRQRVDFTRPGNCRFDGHVLREAARTEAKPRNSAQGCADRDVEAATVAISLLLGRVCPARRVEITKLKTLARNERRSSQARRAHWPGLLS